MFTAEEVRNLRRQQKLTQQQLADLVGVSRTTVINWEMGKNIPDSQNVFNIAQALKVPVSALICKEDKASSQPFPEKAPAESQEKEMISAAPGGKENDRARKDIIKQILMDIFDAQEKIGGALSCVEELNDISAANAELLDWHLRYLENRISLAREKLATVIGLHKLGLPHS